MNTHSPLPVGAIKTKVLILLIVLIVCGVAGTVIFTHLLKGERKPDAGTSVSPASVDGAHTGVEIHLMIESAAKRST